MLWKLLFWPRALPPLFAPSREVLSGKLSWMPGRRQSIFAIHRKVEYRLCFLELTMQWGKIRFWGGLGNQAEQAEARHHHVPLLMPPGVLRDQPQKLAPDFFLYHRELQLTWLEYLNNIHYLLIGQPRLSVTYTTEASCAFFPVPFVWRIQQFPNA